MEKDLNKADVTAFLQGMASNEDDAHAREIIQHVIGQMNASRKRILIASDIAPDATFMLMDEISKLSDETRGERELIMPGVVQLVGTFEQIYGEALKRASGYPRTRKKPPRLR